MLKDLNDHLESIQVLDVEYFYDHLLDLSNEREPKTNEDFRKSENFVDGCQSSLWLWSNNKDNVWQFDVISDAHMVQGLGQIISDTYTGMTTNEVLETKFNAFVPLARLLTTQRQRGLQSVINHVHKRVK
jgi:cysteine desulfuration protein SufE